jgi:glycosyltransferase involved in cell wall biosynthesis
MIRMLAVARTIPRLGGVSPVCYYRAALPVDIVGRKHRDIEAQVISSDDMRRAVVANVTDSLYEGKDLYVLPRLHHREGFDDFKEYIHSWGGQIVFDTDDDLTDDHRRIGTGGDFKYTAQHADHVTVSTPYLAKRLEPIIGYKPKVLANHIHFPWFSKTSLGARRINTSFTLGFVGTSTHYEDWKYPVDALRKLAKRYPDICLGVAGYCPDYLRDLPNAILMEPVPYENYPRLIRQFDVVCCSLDADDEFNKSKSAIKAIESMTAGRVLSNGKIGGAVAVCTDMPVYRRVVSNRNNGLLVSNDDWYDALEHLVRERAFYNNLSGQGHKWARKNRDMTTTGWKKWARFYTSLVNGGRK